MPRNFPESPGSLPAARPRAAVVDLVQRAWSREPFAAVAAAAARLAADTAAADAALLVERTLGNRLVTPLATLGFAPDPVSRDLAEPHWHAHDAAEASDGVLLVADLRLRPTEPAFFGRQGFRSVLAARVGDPTRPFGVLAVYARAPQAFTADDLRAVQALAGVLGLEWHRRQLGDVLDRERDDRVRLAALIEGADDAIVSARLDGTVVSWNPGAERLYGYAAHEIVGQNVSRLVPAERDADRQRLLDRVSRGERIPAFDAEHRRKDGSAITISLSLSPIQDQRGEVVAIAGIAHDVTTTRRLEAELQQTAKMQAVGRLAGGLAHDFNNMLTVIDGYSELLLMKLAADHPVRGLVEEIHKAGERAAELTRQLMVFSRDSMVEPEVLDLSDAVRADAEMLARVVGDDVVIDTALAPELAHVMADRAQFEQVLVNLVLNARDAMPDGGRITIATANLTLDAPRGTPPHAVPAGQYVVLTVSDTGHGMDADTRARIFQPFFTTKGSGRGTGLGLAMLQRFVMQSGGHVDVESAPGAGATFRLYLPTVPLPVAARRDTATPGDAPPGTETVLVVEDEASVRVFAEAVLNASGYQVLSATNGVEALALARTTSGPIHLLMTDVVMPVLGGPALAEQLAVLHPECRVLFTSGYRPEAVGRHGAAIAAASFLQKPFAPAALCRKIREVLDRGGRADEG